ncbi:MAG: spore maturation protein [Clostridiales bacterium]|nr:spore maturation protein [Clostridiales bacterium]
MMKILVYLSNGLIPFVIFYVVAYGMLQKVEVYEEFIKGAKEGLKTVVSILPTLIGLMVAVGILRASGALEFFSAVCSYPMNYLHFPAELIPLASIKMFSSSAATGLLLDIYREYGVDSYLGILASIMMSCSETIFYTMSLYFMTAKVTKSRYTLSGALFATFAGIVASVLLTGWMF